MTKRNWFRGVWSRLSLAGKLTISYTSALLLIASVVALAAGIVVVRGIRREGSAAAAAAARATAVALEEIIEAYHDSYLFTRAETAGRIVSQTAPATGSIAAVDYIRAQNEDASGLLFVTDDQGSIVFYPGDPDPAVVAGVLEAAPRVIEAGAVYFSYRLGSPESATSAEYHAYARYVPGWRWIVVAAEETQNHVGRLPQETLHRILESSAPASTTAAALFTADGEMVVSSEGWTSWPDVAIPSISDEDSAAHIVDLVFGETQKHIAFAQLPEFGATVGVLHDASYLERLLGRFVLILALSGVAATVAVVLVSRQAAAFVTAPVRKAVGYLVGTAADRADGPRTGDELATLVRRLLRTSVKLDYERRQRAVAEDELAISATVYREMGEGIMILEPDGTISRVNPAFASITSYDNDDLRGRTPEALMTHEKTSEYAEKVWDTLRENGEWLGEIEIVRKSGELVPILLSIRAVLGPGNEPRHYIGVVRDISDIRSTQDRLQHLATHDPLTDLTNRTYLSESLGRTIEARQRRGGSAAVLFVDLDHFKDVNDAHGHHAGDELLQTVANRLRSTIRAEDSIARFGGDEFVIVLSELQSSSTVDEVVRRMLNAVREPANIGGIMIRPSVTAGVAIYPESGSTAEDLLKNADAAMYEAKRIGRGGYRYHDPAINNAVRVRLAVQDRVRFSLRTGEFVLLWQPIVRTEDSRIIGAEALIRRRNGDLLETPDSFLPQIEDSTVIIELAHWVLSNTAETLAAIGSELPEGFRVAVNVSATEILQRDFVPVVLDTLESHSVPASRLAVEVTEGAAIRDIPTAQSVIRGLRRHGISVYLDDFGTGHSSLQYLRELGVDAMKLDRSFMEDVPESKASCSLVRGVVDMAHGLGLSTTVEGVEHANQLEFLKSIQCDHIQGYHTGLPMPVEECITRIKDETETQ